MAKHAGFRLGIYVFKDAEVVDFAAPYGVISVARRPMVLYITRSAVGK